MDTEKCRDHLETYPSDPRCGQTAQHGEQVEGEEAGDVQEELLRHNKVIAVPLDVRVDGGEDGQRDEEDEEDIEELRGRLLEDLPVRRSALDVLLVGGGLHQGCVLLLQQFVVPVKFLKRKLTSH